MSKSIEDSQSVVAGSDSKYIDGINEERFDLFLADLRSGDYQQGTGALHVVNHVDADGTKVETFCCLGIACIRPAAEGVITVRRPDDDAEYDYTNVRYDGWNTVDLPIAVADYLGIPQANRVDESNNSCNVAFLRMGWKTGAGSASRMTAIGFNDSLGKSFNEIADAFEKEFLKEEV